MTEVYRCIGKGVTDANGVAHMTHSTSDGGSTWTDISTNPGYTGTGKGLVDLCASPDDPSTINSGSVQSEPYTVCDALFYDVGISSDGTCKNTNWHNYNNVLSVSCDNTGKTLSKSGTGNGYYVANQNNTSDYVFTAPFCCEFEIVSVSSVRFQIVHNNQNITLADGDKIKFTIKDGKYTLTKNDVTSDPVNVSETTEQLRFQMMGVSSVKYKDFKVYPI